MASRQRRTRKNRQHPYSGDENSAVSSHTSWDMENPENWTSTKFREELQKLGINIPKTWSKSVLKQLYADNKERCASSPQVIGEDVQTAAEDHIWQVQQTTPAAANDNENSSFTSSQGMHTNEGPRMNIQPSPDVNTRMHLVSTGNGNDVNNMANMFAATLASTFAQCFSGMQQSVNTSISDRIHKGNSDFDLEQWYSHRNVNDARVVNKNASARVSYSPPETDLFTNSSALPFAKQAGTDIQNASRGVRSDSFTNVDIVSPNIQRNIIAGKDINLATLLMPNYEAPQTHSVTADEIKVNLSNKPDPRLNKSLTIQEFIQAFGKYKRIMYSVYPERREELDAYEDDIIKIHSFFGEKFYSYHKQFSAKAAVILREKRTKVDWSIRDRDILSLVSGGIRVNSCILCNQVDHSTQFCPLQMSTQQGMEMSTHRAITNQTNHVHIDRVDRQGRTRVFFDGKEVCNNFNNIKGCYRSNCNLLHACNKCRATGHSATTCTGARQPYHTPGPKTTQTAKPTTSKNPENKHNSK